MVYGMHTKHNIMLFWQLRILLLETTASRALGPLDLLTVPSMRSKHCESIEPESHQMAKMYFILLLFHSKLRDPLTIDFRQRNCILHWAVHQPIVFSQVWSLTKYLKPQTQELWLICDTIFFPCVHAQKALSSETKLLLKIAELEVRFCQSTLTQFLNKGLGEEACEDRPKWRTSAQFKHVPAAKKVT